MTSRTTRREFLKVSAGAAAAAAAGPVLWLPKVSLAATEAHGAVKHLLVLFAKGGLRSHCVFNAVGTRQHNPFGTQDSPAGTQWQLGAACGRKSYETSLGRVPSFADVSDSVTVLPCVDHRPGEGVPDTDHRTATNRIAMGDPEGSTGLLARLGRDMPRYKDGFAPTPDAMPPVEIRPTEFGFGAGEYASARPLSIQGARNAFVANLPIGRGWKVDARAAMDLRFRARRSRAYRSRISSFLLAKERASRFADVLQDPRLNLLQNPGAAESGVSNAQLLEVLGNHTLDEIGDEQPVPSWGPDVAMALRFFGFGSPMCVVTRDIYDLHDEERDRFSPRTEDLVRQLAGLRFLLGRMEHPAGGVYWDHTMVAVVSEFSRNNTGTGGFNSGFGSDHTGEDADPSRNQAVALMGGAITIPGKRLGATDDEMMAQDKVFSSRRLLSTFLDVLGMDPKDYWPDEPIAELFT